MTTRHYHLISRASSARAAVRDLQDQATALRTARTSGLRIVRRANGTHVMPIDDDSQTRTTSTGEARWA